MAWYKEGTVGVTNGSTAVTLSGGNALANIFVGDTFLGPDGRPYEVAQVTSAGGFVLAKAYEGPTASGQPYEIQPTAQSGALRLLLDQVSNLVTNYQGGRDAWSSAASGTLKGRKSAGAGLVEDLSPSDALGLLTSGSAAATLTGSELLATLQGGEAANVTTLRLVHEILSLDPAAARALLALANHELVSVDTSGNVGIGTSSPKKNSSLGTVLTINGSPGTNGGAIELTNGENPAAYFFTDGSSAIFGTQTAIPLVLRTDNTERVRIDRSGNLLVGTAAGTSHGIAKSVARGDRILSIWSPIINNAVEFYAGDTWGPNAAATVLKIGSNSVTGRSINAGGTVTASGADYAEYLFKTVGCGIIQPGDICGITADGLLTDKWADAHTFVIKSTDPAYVGNDTWAQAAGPRPEQPALVLPEYTGPERPADDDPDYEAKLAEWTAAQEAHADAVTAAQGAYTEAMAAYQVALADFEARLETERQKVDRIAFSGQVPANVLAAQPGQYIDAAPGPDGGIIGVPVEAPGPRTVGKVWKILEDGRAWVAVMIS